MPCSEVKQLHSVRTKNLPCGASPYAPHRRPELSQRDLDRIEALGLITRSDDDVALTPLGKMRYEALPRATRIDDPDENFIEMLKACVVQLRK
jgi:hypothetical protein